MKNLIQRKLRTRFHVTPRSGVQFSGVLIAEDARYAVFADVVAYPDDASLERVEGDLYIRHENIAYVQTATPHADQ